ncbi:RagB/SusD family nutrient uptake outer membrane protein [Spirosoma fluminis]
MYDDIKKERQVEFLYEGYRWFNLVRTGRAQVVMNAHYASWMILSLFSRFCKTKSILTRHWSGKIPAIKPTEHTRITYAETD